MNINEMKKLKVDSQRVLQRTLNMMNTGNKLNKGNSNVIVNFGGGSYTDGKQIVVGIDTGLYEDDPAYKDYTEALGKEPDFNDGWAVALGYGWHEEFHRLFSNFKDYCQFGEWFKKTFAHCGTTAMHEHIIHKFGMQFNNGIEDGRIEYFGVNLYPGSAKNLSFLRSMHWMLDKEGNPSEAAKFSMTCCYWAAMGLRPQYYDKCPDRMKDAFEKIKYDIDDIIQTANTKKVNAKLQKMVLKIKPYIEELLKEELANADMMQALQEMLEKMIEEFEGANSPGQGQAEEIESSGGSGQTITIRRNSSSSGSGSGQGQQGEDSNEESSEKGKGSGSGQGTEGSEQKDEESGTGSGSEGDKDDKSKDGSSDENGSGKDGKDGKDSKSGEDGDKDGKDGKSGKDGKDSKADQKGKDANPPKRQRAPGYAERGGNESSSSNEEQTASRDNNGQGTNPSGNSAPDDTDRTIRESNESLIAEIREELQSMSEDAGKNYSSAMQKEKKELANAPESSSISPEEIEEIRKGYNDRNVEGYKAVEVDVSLESPDEVKMQGRSFRREIEKTLKSQNDIYLRGTKSGRINKMNLHKIVQNDYRLFQKKIEPNKTNAAVAICWDGSGSMSGTKQRQSTVACAIIEEGLKGLIPLKIVNFTTSYSNMVHHYIVKDFSDVDKRKNYAYSYGASRSFSGGNKDGYSIKILAKELEKRSEEQKLLIVLSDGLPSDYPSIGKGMGDVHDAVKAARKKGIEVISIMFGEKDFRESEYDNYLKMYESGLISTDPARIQEELIKQIKKCLFK